MLTHVHTQLYPPALGSDSPSSHIMAPKRKAQPTESRGELDQKQQEFVKHRALQTSSIAILIRR